MAEPPSLDAGGLCAIQAAHRRAIPFENLSVRMGGSVSSEADTVFDKLVTQERGGFCFEHNRLFADMLALAGFSCRLLLARVLLGNPEAMPPRTHCLLLVALEDGDWIADAGFGGAYAPPMPLADGAEAQSRDGALHRLRHCADEGALPGSWLLHRKGPRLAGDGRAQSDDAWEPQYAFDMAMVAEADLAIGCHWSATHPTSRFTNHTIVSLCLPDGFASMVDRDLTVWRKGHEVDRRKVVDADEYRDVLEAHFGLAMGPADIARLPLFPA